MITYPVAVSMTQWSAYLWECLRSGENETEVEAPMKSGKRCHEASYAHTDPLDIVVSGLAGFLITTTGFLDGLAQTFGAWIANGSDACSVCKTVFEHLKALGAPKGRLTYPKVTTPIEF